MESFLRLFVNPTSSSFIATISFVFGKKLSVLMAMVIAVAGFGFDVQGQNLTVTPTSLAFGNVCVGATSAEQSFTIGGAGLTSANLSVGALAGYQFSLAAGGPYTNSLSAISNPSAAPIDVFVRFSPAAAVAYNGNVAISGGGLGSAAGRCGGKICGA